MPIFNMYNELTIIAVENVPIHDIINDFIEIVAQTTTHTQSHTTTEHHTVE